MDKDKKDLINTLMVILIVIGIISGIYYKVTTFHNERLEVVCIDNGYKELTDYKKIESKEMFFPELTILTFMVECDNKILSKKYHINSEFKKGCIKYDKWGECIFPIIKIRYGKVH